AASCAGGIIRSRFSIRDRRCMIKGIARSWFGATVLEDPCRHLLRLVGHPQRAESGHRVWRVEIPVVVRESDGIPNRRVARPGATKGGAAEFGGYPRGKEAADVGRRCDRLDRWQSRGIGREIGWGRHRVGSLPPCGGGLGWGVEELR